MMAWLSCSHIPPPISETVMVRAGGRIFFAAYSRMRGWFAVLPGSAEEKIAEPEMWWQKDLSGGVEAGTGEYPDRQGHAGSDEKYGDSKTRDVSRSRDIRAEVNVSRGSSVPPAQNNLPVPVLAESPAEIVPTLQPEVIPLRMSEARESIETDRSSVTNAKVTDSRGGQFISASPEQASPRRSRSPQQAFLGLLAQDSESQSRSAG